MIGSAAPAAGQGALRLLAGHRDLARWTLEGGASVRGPWGWRTQLRWHGWWFDRLERQQMARLSQQRPRQAPVFVLGFWRSGTTLLHQWLSALPGHDAPATWQCFNPASFLLTGPPREAADPVSRPMDAGLISPFSPQEDEFALLLQGAPSLYRGFIDPRRLGELAKEVPEVAHRMASASMGADEGNGQDQKPSWTFPWLRFLAGVEQQARGARLVLKSPNHVFRLRVIRSLFPDAPWVWIGRPASAVWHSNLRMWGSMANTYGLWPIPAGALESFLDTCMTGYVRALEEALALRPANWVQWVDFEDLYASPKDLLVRLTECLPSPEGSDWLDVDFQEVLRSRPAEAAGTSTCEVSESRAELFAAYDAVQARARKHWKSSL